MNAKEKKEFIHQLSATIADDLCKQVDDGNIPEEWDGIELRLLMEYRHIQSARMSRNLKGRVRDFNNHMIISPM